MPGALKNLPRVALTFRDGFAFFILLFPPSEKCFFVGIISFSTVPDSTPTPTMQGSARDIWDALSPAEWKELCLRLLLCATKRHIKYLKDIPGAPEPRDLVQAALTDWFTGKRNCPENTKLLHCLCMIIKSKVSHVLNSADTARRVDGKPDISPDKTAEKDHFHQFTLEELERVIQDDPLLVSLVRLYYKDPSLKAADCAEMLGKPVHEIYNANRRLKRKLAGWHEARSR